jgi:hypoxanthine phosphoribosyltransferase
MHPDIAEVLFTEQDIRARVAELGEQIARDHAGQDLLLVCVLRGAAVFMADLARAIHLPLEMDYMAVSSYGNATTSSGVVRILKDLDTDISGRHVVIAEDILDSGLTLSRLIEVLGTRQPASIEVAALLRKDIPRTVDVECRYVGFECPDAFLVGYGLDYAERYRNLPYVGVLKEEVYREDAN